MFIPRTISTAIDKLARAALGKDWSLYAALLDHWPEIVGQEYARFTTPVKITFPPRQAEARRSGGTLVIRIPKGLAMEFSFKIGIIRARIADFFGYAPIDKIIFESVYSSDLMPRTDKTEITPENLKTVQSMTREIQDDDLRTALENLGQSIFKEKS